MIPLTPYTKGLSSNGLAPEVPRTEPGGNNRTYCVKEFATLEFKKACALTLLLTVEPNCENSVTVFVTTAGLSIVIEPVVIVDANSLSLPGDIFIVKV